MKNDPKLKETIIETLYKESKKEGIEYRRHALKAFTEVLHELEEDEFKKVYDIAQEVLPKVSHVVHFNKLGKCIWSINVFFF